jgi:hypothetical protein
MRTVHLDPQMNFILRWMRGAGEKVGGQSTFWCSVQAGRKDAIDRSWRAVGAIGTPAWRTESDVVNIQAENADRAWGGPDCKSMVVGEGCAHSGVLCASVKAGPSGLIYVLLLRDAEKG